jgi:hypothetical protein
MLDSVSLFVFKREPFTLYMLVTNRNSILMLPFDSRSFLTVAKFEDASAFSTLQALAH